MPSDEYKNEHQEESNPKHIEEQLLHTIKTTTETNAKLMEVLDQQQKQSVRQQDIQQSIISEHQDAIKKELKFKRWKLALFLAPVFLGIIYVAKASYDEYAEFSSPEGYVAQVSITGTIQQGSSTAGSDAVIPALRSAFADNMAKGVLIRISSPGGSPSQSAMIHDEIVRLREKYPEKKMALVGIEFLTSGALWIASASPEIAVLDTTYVGSIGVITTQFNFSNLIEKIGIDRVVITSGESKSRLDQFMPSKEQDINKMKSISNYIHESFKRTIMASRGDKLNASEEELFNGDFWMGKQSVELGLVDEVTTPTRLMLREFGTVKIRDYSKRPSFMESVGLTKIGNIITMIEQSLFTYGGGR